MPKCGTDENLVHDHACCVKSQYIKIKRFYTLKATLCHVCHVEKLVEKIVEYDSPPL
jgi:hypothetical protein